MRSPPCGTLALLAGAPPMRCAEPAVSNAGELRRLLGNSRFFLFLFTLSYVLRLGFRDIPEQGLTPPLHPRKGHRPLTLFRCAFPWGLSFMARYRWHVRRFRAFSDAYAYRRHPCSPATLMPSSLAEKLPFRSRSTP